MGNSVTQDMAYRQSICKYAEKHGITSAAIKYEKSKQYVAFWLKRYDGTLGSMAKRSRKPHSHAKEHTAMELKWITDYRRRLPELGLQDFWLNLREKEQYRRTITALYRVMVRLGYFEKRIKKKPPKPQKMEPMRYAGERVQIDVKVVPKACLTGAQGQKLYQYTAIDEYSRLRYLEGFMEQSTCSSAVFLVHAAQYFKRRGFYIECVQTDNGFEFTNRFGADKKQTLFEKMLDKAGIRHKLIRPYTPRHNGKVERSHREDQKRLYDTHSFYSIDDFNKQLSIHLERSNNRPMRPLNYLSPLQFLRASVKNV